MICYVEIVILVQRHCGEYKSLVCDSLSDVI